MLSIYWHSLYPAGLNKEALPDFTSLERQSHVKMKDECIQFKMIKFFNNPLKIMKRVKY